MIRSRMNSSHSGKLSRSLNLPFALSTETALTGAIILAALASRLWELGARVMSHDESLHAYFSWLLASGRGFAHNPMMHGPSLFEVTAFLQLILGASDFITRLAPALVGVLIVAVVPRLLQPWLGRGGAFAVSLLLLLSPYVTYFSRYIRHDILVISAFLLVVYSVFRYLGERQESSLYVLAGAEALMLATMEISFIYLAILAGFLVLQAAHRYRLDWGSWRHSAEFDLVVLLATLGAFFSSPIALVGLNPLFERISGEPFVDLAVFDTQSMGWASGPASGRIWLLLLAFILAATAIGLWWGRGRWLSMAGVFCLVTGLLYTTFMTHPSGLGSGLIGSLGYWLSQHGVARGTQPWYYYLLVFPLYEYLPLLAGLAAGVYFLLRRRTLESGEAIFVSFLLWWAGAIFLGLTWAGEKMPWLSTHITVPFILLGGWGLGRLWPADSAPAGHSRTASIPPPGQTTTRALHLGALGLAAVLALLTARTNYLANFVNYDYTTEYIDYAHGAPGVRWLMEALDEVGDKTAAGKTLKVAYDSDVAWPLNWYLRDYGQQIYYGEEPTREILDAPVIVAGDVSWPKVESMVGDGYDRFDLIRMWWPLEDYKNLTWDRVRRALTDPEMRAALWDILWQRDYSRYAELTGQVIDPPRRWPLSDRMRVYVRRDVPVNFDRLKIGAYRLEDESTAGAYREVRVELKPEQMVTAAGLKAPRDLALAPDGSIYVADTGNSRVVRLNPNDDSILQWGSPSPGGQAQAGTFSEPWGIAVAGDGSVYVADTWNHRIQKFTPQGELLQVFGRPGLVADGPDHFWGPRGVAVDADGNVYVTDTGNRRVAVFDPAGNYLRQFGDSGEGALNEPVGIAISREGEVFVADTWNQRVVVFSTEGRFLRAWPVLAWSGNSLDNKPHLAVDAAGNVYIVDPESFRVVVFSKEGQPKLTFGQYGSEPGAFGLPSGIAVGPDGAIWIADAGNSRVVRYPAPPDLDG